MKQHASETLTIYSMTHTNYLHNSPLQIVELVDELLMLLLVVLHRVEPLDVSLRLLVHVVQFLVPHERVLRRHLQYDRDLRVREDLHVGVELGSEGQLGGVLDRDGGGNSRGSHRRG